MVEPSLRISNLEQLQRHKYMKDVDFAAVLQREIKPGFVPPVSTHSFKNLEYFRPISFQPWMYKIAS